MKIAARFISSMFTAMLFAHCGKKQSAPAQPAPPGAMSGNTYKSKYFEQLMNNLRPEDTAAGTALKNMLDKMESDPNMHRVLEELDKQPYPSQVIANFVSAGKEALTGWLEAPAELGATPKDIEFVQQVAVKDSGHSFDYYVYRFKVAASDPRANNGWMLGVAGPYTPASSPNDWAPATCSRYTTAGETTPRKEAEWIHKHIYKGEHDE